MYEGDLVRLRALCAEDAERYVNWLNDIGTMRLSSSGAPRPRSLEEVREQCKRPDGNRFAVETLDGRLIGMCNAFEIEDRNRSCKVGWQIGDPTARGKGYGSDMIRVFLGYLFRERNMERVELGVFAFNASAARLYEKLGFVREGALRDQVLAAGRRWDMHMYGMLRREYEARYGA